MTILLFFLLFLKVGFSFDSKNFEIISSLVHSLVIRQCVIITILKDGLFYGLSLKVRILSERKVFTSYCDFFKLEKYVNEMDYPETKTAMILEAKNDHELLKISNELNKVTID